MSKILTGKTPNVPPGNLIAAKTPHVPIGHLAFTEKSAGILQPLVLASLDGSYIRASAVIQVDAALYDAPPEPINFNIYLQYCVSESGLPQPQVYIAADFEILPSSSYRSIKIVFNITDADLPSYVLLKEIKTLQVFLWDVDPRTSRGTITTVLDTAPQGPVVL